MCSIFLLAFATSLEGQTTINLQALATSSFETHSLMATISVVQGVIYCKSQGHAIPLGSRSDSHIAVVKSPIAKAADVLGHFAAFNASMFFLVLGYIQQACSHNIQTFASAQAFYATGMTGLQILQQIFIADTSSLLNRALFLSLPFTPFLVNVWLGPVLAGFFSNTDGSGPWRWGHAIWAIILPVMFVPLAVSLFLNEKKAKKYDIGIRFRQRTTILQTMKD